MAANEGIIFGDYFLDEKTFVSLFKDYYENKKNEIDAIINNILVVLKEEEYVTIEMVEDKSVDKNFIKLWEQFQKQVLLNQETILDLLVIYRDDSRGENIEFSNIVKQKEVEKKGDKYYGISTANEIVKIKRRTKKAQQVEQFLRLHLSGFLKQLEGPPLNRSQARNLRSKHDELIKSKKNFVQQGYFLDDEKEREHFTGKSWNELAYGDLEENKKLAQAHEAFLNHLAQYESYIFNYLKDKGISTDNLDTVIKFQNEKETVFLQHGVASRSVGTLPELLFTQQNPIPWYAGGDIIIVDEQRRVIYNIQLKTTTKKKLTFFTEAIAKLRTFLKNFTKEDDPEKKAKRLFQNFKNTIAGEIKQEISNEASKTIDDIMKDIKEEIKKKYNIIKI